MASSGSQEVRQLPNGTSVVDEPTIVTGTFSKKQIKLPNDAKGFPVAKPFCNSTDSLSASIVTQESIINIDPNSPDILNHRLKLGVLVPATNTTMETELWMILQRNPEIMDGVGVRTTPVKTSFKVANKDDVAEYGRQFLAGLQSALPLASMASPHYLIVGMSLEHVLDNMDVMRQPILDLEKDAGVGVAAWHDAVAAALNCFGAKRIALLTPFDPTGDGNARNMFKTLGFDVVRSVGMNCASAVDICHVPIEAKEKAIKEYLVPNPGPDNDIDAIVQCGTNLSMIDVTEKIEEEIGVPVIGINAALLWYALRECGVMEPLHGCGRLLREH